MKKKVFIIVALIVAGLGLFALNYEAGIQVLSCDVPDHIKLKKFYVVIDKEQGQPLDLTDHPQPIIDCKIQFFHEFRLGFHDVELRDENDLLLHKERIFISGREKKLLFVFEDRIRLVISDSHFL